MTTATVRTTNNHNHTISSWNQTILGAGILLLLSTIYWTQQLENRELIQRKFWDKFYDRCSILYDSVDWFTFDAAQKLRLHVLDYLPTKNDVKKKKDDYSILEIGVGTGRLHVEIAKRFKPNQSAAESSDMDFYLAGFDMAPGMIELTRQRLVADGNHNLKSDLRIGDVTQVLPWADESFDIVLSTFALSAISDVAAACQEMSRVVKPGGKIIIVDAGTARNNNRMASFLAWIWETLGDYMRDDDEILSNLGLLVTREDFGPWDSVHITVGEKP